MPEFNSLLGTILLFDLALVFFTLGVTALSFGKRVQIRAAGAASGVILILTGMWLGAVVSIDDILRSLYFWAAPGPRNVEFEAVRHGDLGWLLNLASAVLIGTGLWLLIHRVLYQFREQARLLDASKEREGRLHQAAQLARLGFYIYDREHRKVLYCTEQHAAAHGLSVTEFAEKSDNIDSWLQVIHPEDRDLVRRRYASVHEGNTVEMEYRVPTAEGERRVREVASSLRDDTGAVVRIIGTSQDVTEQRRMEHLLRQSVKMEAIGNLTGGIAHDFNNLLAVILGNLELAKEIPEDQDTLLDEAVSATIKGAELTKNMLSFARRAPLDPAEIDLNRIVLETKKWAARTLPPTIEVETSLLAGLWPIRADRTSTESALLNLILNARDAMPKGGKLTLETANVRIDDDYVAERGEDLESGRYVMLAVSDTGEGIAVEVLPRIFDPFFTTKGPGKGSGLGLSMIQGFMKQSGGTVRVYSEPGMGTTFKLYFRALNQKPGHVAAPTRYAPASAKGNETVVLLAEDEPAVTTVLVRALREAGYVVIAAESGDAALAAFEAAERVDVVLTDIVMPGNLQGPALVGELRKRDPALPAVFMSGYANEATVHGNGLRPEDIRLMKPVSRSDLLAALRQALAVAADEGAGQGD